MYPKTDSRHFNGEAQFLLMTADLNVKLLMISFSSRDYKMFETQALSFMNSFDDTSLDAYGFVFEENAAIFGTMKTYFAGTTLTQDTGFIQMTEYQLSSTDSFYEGEGDTSTISPVKNADNSKTFTSFTVPISITDKTWRPWTSLSHVDLNFDFDTREEGLEKFDRNEW